MENDLANAVVVRIEETAATAESGEYFRKPLVGFSAADDPLYEEVVKIVGPHHWRPKDFLAGAKTVISFFIPFRKEVVLANRNDGPVSEVWGLSYLAANALINQINRNLGDSLAEMGYDSRSVPATHTHDPKSLQAAWSHRSAAFVAGLGRFGLNRMLITRLGCAGRLGTVFTSAELPAGKRNDEERCLFYKNGSCGLCRNACPPAILTERGFDRFQCNDRLLANKEELSGKGIVADVCGKCVVAGPCAYKAE